MDIPLGWYVKKNFNLSDVEYYRLGNFRTLTAVANLHVWRLGIHNWL